MENKDIVNGENQPSPVENSDSDIVFTEIRDDESHSSHHSHTHHSHSHRHQSHSSHRPKSKSSSKISGKKLTSRQKKTIITICVVVLVIIVALAITFDYLNHHSQSVVDTTGEIETGAEYADPTVDIVETNTLENKIQTIKHWDAPIYDANIPVFQLTEEKPAMTDAVNTPEGIYAMYDSLMAKNPDFITKIDLGVCSDGVTHIYRYDFREPEPHRESGKLWSETKVKAIIVTGIHYEWAGIYAVYNALEEITENDELRDFRRNVHLIVVPVANPYATIGSNYKNSSGVKNANGVEIHRNFEVDWILTEPEDKHYGGAAPLSEVETQYIDNILKNNTDAAFFLTCHNYGTDSMHGTSFIWSSAATKYMCNMGYRLVDKLSLVWMEKYGDVLSAGIEEYKTNLVSEGDVRLGRAELSSTPGTETKQALKYGIQGTNVEIGGVFQIHGTKDNPEPTMSSFTMSRGTEVYINFLLTAFGCYDYKDKAVYFPE